jgi:hypothetical protein
MFISSKEKVHIQNAIESLRFGLADATTEILYLKAKIKVLEDKSAPKPIKPPKKTEAQLKAELKKARQRVYSKAYYQRKKEREQVLNVGS